MKTMFFVCEDGLPIRAALEFDNEFGQTMDFTRQEKIYRGDEMDIAQQISEECKTVVIVRQYKDRWDKNAKDMAVFVHGKKFLPIEDNLPNDFEDSRFDAYGLHDE